MKRVTVVECKDCLFCELHHKTHYNGDIFTCYKCCYWYGSPKMTSPIDYCSHAVKRGCDIIEKEVR